MSDVSILLSKLELTHLECLANAELSQLYSTLDKRGLPALLSELKLLGVSKLSERQALANGMGRLRRGGDVKPSPPQQSSQSVALPHQPPRPPSPPTAVDDMLTPDAPSPTETQLEDEVMHLLRAGHPAKALRIALAAL